MSVNKGKQLISVLYTTTGSTHVSNVCALLAVWLCACVSDCSFAMLERMALKSVDIFTQIHFIDQLISKILSLTLLLQVTNSVIEKVEEFVKDM